MPLTDVLLAVLQLTVSEKMKLLRIIADDLDARGDIRPLQRGEVYDIATPYGCYEAAEALADAIANEKIYRSRFAFDARQSAK